ncbi:terpene synthase family protein [Nocardia arizonensis]|uniref:terpene synthase family protein n=1 Tax=Nocardia arizonensis TaxID=1141647 RepID=UPI0006D24879|nr:hypothetical protein [Nocardia arizonensis]
MTVVDNDALTPARACPYHFDPNPNSARTAELYQDIIGRLGLNGHDGAHVLGSAVNIVGAAAMVYPAVDEDTLLAGALWIATLIVNDDRWDNVGTAAYTPGQVERALHLIERGAHDARALQREDDDPFAGLLGATIQAIHRVAGAPATARIVREIKNSFLGMHWERKLNPKDLGFSLHSYLAVRRLYSTMNVQVLLDRCFNGSPQMVIEDDDPIIGCIDEIVCRFGALANDYYSWHREKQHVDASNAVGLLMHTEALSESDALTRVAQLSEQAIADFTSIENAIENDVSPRTRGAEILAQFDVHKPLLAAAARWPEQTSRYDV